MDEIILGEERSDEESLKEQVAREEPQEEKPVRVSAAESQDVPEDSNLLNAVILFAWTDLRGMFDLHRHQWRIFYDSVKVAIGIIAFPVVATGFLVSTGAVELNLLYSLGDLPIIVTTILLAASVLGPIVLLIAVHLRLDTLVYSRALNSFRKSYTELLTTIPGFQNFRTGMPISPYVPDFYEPTRFMGLLVMIFSSIHAIYLVIGVANIWKHLQFGCLTILGLLAVSVQYAAYYFVDKRRKRIAGWADETRD